MTDSNKESVIVFLFSSLAAFRSHLIFRIFVPTVASPEPEKKPIEVSARAVCYVLHTLYAKRCTFTRHRAKMRLLRSQNGYDASCGAAQF